MNLHHLIAGCISVFRRENPGICWRCAGHRCIEIYDTSDEYAAPCPVCVGADAYHAKIASKNAGSIPSELRWRDPALGKDLEKRLDSDG